MWFWQNELLIYTIVFDVILSLEVFVTEMISPHSFKLFRTNTSMFANKINPYKNVQTNTTYKYV